MALLRVTFECRAGLDASLPENLRERAECRQPGLQAIHADEGRKPQPVGTMVVREHEAQQNEKTRCSYNDAIDVHVLLSIVQ